MTKPSFRNFDWQGEEIPSGKSALLPEVPVEVLEIKLTRQIDLDLNQIRRLLTKEQQLIYDRLLIEATQGTSASPTQNDTERTAHRCLLKNVATTLRCMANKPYAA